MTYEVKLNYCIYHLQKLITANLNFVYKSNQGLLLLFSNQVMSDSFATSWTAACQTPPSMGFPRQEYWSGLPFPTPGDLPDPGIEPMSLAWQVILY